jgi:uncharacterized protein (TIGR02145 family)
VRNENLTKTILEGLIKNDLYDNTLLLFSPETGIKTRETTVSSTPLTFVSKGYSLDPTPNDLTQTTELDQPYLSGNIAPNERYAIKNPNTATRVITHPQIAYTNAQRWSVTICARWNGTINTIAALFGKNTTVSAIRIKNTTVGNVFAVTNESGTTVNGTVSTTKLIGKNVPITFVGDLTSVKIYVDGALFDTITISSEFNFVSLLRGLSAANTQFEGVVHYYRIQDNALTLTQVQAEHTLLRSIYPEIESVQIGTQTWATSNLEMVRTPMGNVIPEVQDAADWANATNLYDAAIAGGDSVQVATRKAAMWCYYDNDPNIGAIYGKLYNWYAAKMIQDDIDAYNAANPTEPWGWRVPTLADWTTLTNSVSESGDLCVPGTYFDNYYGAGNNSSGLSLLGSGNKRDSGGFIGLRRSFFFQAINETNRTRHIAPPSLYGTDTSVTAVLRGCSIRLIKDE